MALKIFIVIMISALAGMVMFLFEKINELNSALHLMMNQMDFITDRVYELKYRVDNVLKSEQEGS